MKVKINEGCIGCGLCEETCPEVFSLKEDGKAQVDKQPEPSQLSQVQEAVELCPAQVIELSNW
ncbi:ferredoxin [Aminipila luticellarii]|uniref:Ferredoxin n=1 Tax=Aminipila luticellarii TaxID=2507160 RepID=A0A410PTP9_9FIRM|nr:ferredoxin [Aminipila luticellarii]QAT42342.1 ferredoxin [Aminipila luticellarii]